MVEQLKIYEDGIIAIEVINSFDEKDMKYVSKLFEEKREAHYNQINILVKLDELRATKVGIKAFYDDFVWTLRNYKNLGKIAIVGDSRILKSLVSADNLFYKNHEKGREEKYFEKDQMDDAYKFITEQVLVK